MNISENKQKKQIFDNLNSRHSKTAFSSSLLSTSGALWNEINMRKCSNKSSDGVASIEIHSVYKHQQYVLQRPTNTYITSIALIRSILHSRHLRLTDMQKAYADTWEQVRVKEWHIRIHETYTHAHNIQTFSDTKKSVWNGKRRNQIVCRNCWCDVCASVRMHWLAIDFLIHHQCAIVIDFVCSFFFVFVYDTVLSQFARACVYDKCSWVNSKAFYLAITELRVEQTTEKWHFAANSCQQTFIYSK